MLLFTGRLTCDADGQALIDGRDTMQKFWPVQAGLRGGEIAGA